ncbi:amphi-Trp domain-containing protein [Natrinema halophilum]|uniref:Amphi-Trp domain-containing protein n=1 Tax=Natrinema halophilum TaxID=1699371 RepID=A0A7D5GFY7_9EURY|nr:amphi-Trp domain-containing protein [Natrinema halophilum]QLG47974.1 amphi-Trp domain-containing protein [Natrinema halophilum]
MDDRVDLPDDRTSDRRTITSGFFEQEVYLSSEETATFLHDLADQLEAGSSFTVSTSEWELPFDYSDPVEVEIEFSEQRERELEIELEFTEPDGGDDLTVR